MLDLTDFAVQERPEGNLMVAISRPWYNCSYTMAAKPIKSLELHYTMMQFLIINGSRALSLTIMRRLTRALQTYDFNFKTGNVEIDEQYSSL